MVEIPKLCRVYNQDNNNSVNPNIPLSIFCVQAPNICDVNLDNNFENWSHPWYLSSYSDIFLSILRVWVKISYFICLVILTCVVLLEVVSQLQHGLSEQLNESNFIFFHGIVVAGVLTFLEGYCGFLFVEGRGRSWDKNQLIGLLKETPTIAQDLWKVKMEILGVFGILLLGGYLMLLLLGLEGGYVLVLSPTVFMSETVVIMWIIVHAYIGMYFICEPVSWKNNPKLYSTLNKFTKIPLILQLLKPIPSISYPSTHHEPVSQNTSISTYSIEALARINTDCSELYKTGLIWMINLLSSSAHCANNKISIYWNSGRNIKVGNEVSFMEIFAEFAAWKLGEIAFILQQISKFVEVSPTRKLQRNYISEGFETLQNKIWLHLWVIKLSQMYCIHILITEALSMSEMELTSIPSQEKELINSLKDISKFCNKMRQEEGINKLVACRIKCMENKTNSVLNKFGKL